MEQIIAPSPPKKRNFKPKFYAIWGRRRSPMTTPDGERILRDLIIYTRGSSASSLKHMWKYPGSMKANDVRLAIRQEPTNNQVVKDGKRVGYGIISSSSFLQKYRD